MLFLSPSQKLSEYFNLGKTILKFIGWCHKPEKKVKEHYVTLHYYFPRYSFSFPQQFFFFYIMNSVQSFNSC